MRRLLGLFLPAGGTPDSGALLRNQGLARTLEAVASEGAVGIYAGEVGATLARFAAAEGVFFTENDLKVQDARWSEPLVGSYRGVTLYETPAPTQGFTVLEMLSLLQPLELHQHPFLAPDPVHLMIQAKQLAYHDRDQHLADPRFVDVPIEQLYANFRRQPSRHDGRRNEANESLIYRKAGRGQRLEVRGFGCTRTSASRASANGRYWARQSEAARPGLGPSQTVAR